MGEIKDRSSIERIQAEGAIVSSVSVWEMAKYETLRMVTYDAVFQNYLDDILINKEMKATHHAENRKPVYQNLDAISSFWNQQPKANASAPA